jgi:multiple sugar transport system permease protein
MATQTSNLTTGAYERRQQMVDILRQIVIYGLLLIGAAIVLLPFFWMVSTSLKTQEQIFTGQFTLIPDPIAPENYIEVWSRFSSIKPEMTFLRIMGNTLFITLLAMFGEIFSASLVAYGFARFRWRGRNVVFAIMLGTVMVPSIVRRVPAFLLWKELGLLDTYDPMTWPSLFAWGPLYVFLMRQFFLSVPREIEEAAVLDGANTMQIYWHIMLPLVRPVILAIAVLSFQGNWNNFQSPLIYLRTADKYPLALAIQFFDSSVGESGQAPLWHYMMALTTMMAAPVLLLYFLAQKQFIEGINIGAVKG